MNVALQRLCAVCLPGLLIACAPPPPALKELQQRCDHDASSWFKALHPEVTHETVDGAIRTEQYSFSDHYNPARNQCYVVASEQRSTVYPDSPAVGTTGKSLLELESNRRVGRVVSAWPAIDHTLKDCNVESTRCSSLGEWEALAAPYMER